GDGSRAAVRSRGSIPQSGLALSEEASKPLASGMDANPGFERRHGQGGLSINDASNEVDSTLERQSGILVDVHSAESLRVLGWVAPPSLSNSARMNRNNLLNHHSYPLPAVFRRTVDSCAPTPLGSMALRRRVTRYTLLRCLLLAASFLGRFL